MNFDQCDIKINGQRILATDISLSKKSNHSPLYSLNNSFIGYSSSAFEADISISYYVEPLIDPSYNIISGLRQNSNNITPATITIGGSSTSGYLSSYNLSVNNNEPVLATVGYKIYNPISGIIGSIMTTGSLSLYNLSNGSGIAHYWTTYLCSGSEIISGLDVSSASYSVSVDLLPVFGIGQSTPKQVTNISMKEDLDILSETEIGLSNDLVSVTGVLGGTSHIKLKTLSSYWQSDSYSINIPISGMNILSNDIGLSVNNRLISNTKLSNSY